MKEKLFVFFALIFMTACGDIKDENWNRVMKEIGSAKENFIIKK